MSPERLLRKMADRDRLQARIEALDVEIAAGCRAYSDDEGYRITLRPEQVRRAVAAATSRSVQ